MESGSDARELSSASQATERHERRFRSSLVALGASRPRSTTRAPEWHGRFDQDMLVAPPQVVERVRQLLGSEAACRRGDQQVRAGPFRRSVGWESSFSHDPQEEGWPARVPGDDAASASAPVRAARSRDRPARVSVPEPRPSGAAVRARDACSARVAPMFWYNARVAVGQGVDLRGGEQQRMHAGGGADGGRGWLTGEQRHFAQGAARSDAIDAAAVARHAAAMKTSAKPSSSRDIARGCSPSAMSVSPVAKARRGAEARTASMTASGKPQKTAPGQ